MIKQGIETLKNGDVVDTQVSNGKTTKITVTRGDRVVSESGDNLGYYRTIHKLLKKLNGKL